MTIPIRIIGRLLPAAPVARQRAVDYTLAMHLLLNVLVVLAVNALPAWGAFGWHLEPAQLLLLFWFENLGNTFLVSARILFHRRLSRKRGHWMSKSTVTTTSRGVTKTVVNEHGSYLAGFLLPSLVFTLAHGIFVFIFAGQLLSEGGAAGGELLSDQLLLGAKALLVVMGIGFLGDLVGIGQQPFAWMRRITEHALARVVGIHVLLIGGMFALAMFGSPKFALGMLFFLKFSADLSGVLPQAKLKEKPPSWLRFLRHFGKGEGGEGFEEYWARTHRLDEEQARQEEEVLGEDELAAIKNKKKGASAK